MTDKSVAGGMVAGDTIATSDHAASSIPLNEPTTPESATAPPVQSAMVNTFALLVGLGLVAGGIQLLARPGLTHPLLKWLVLGCGIVVFVLTLRSVEANRVSPWQSWQQRVQALFGSNPWQWFCLVLAPLASVVSAIAAGIGERMNFPWLAVGGWLAGIGLVLAGGWQYSGRLASGKAESGKISSATIAVGLILVAFAVRGIDTPHIPVLLSGDEASFGISSANFIERNEADSPAAESSMNNIFVVGWFSFPSFFFFLQSLMIRIFGQTAEALRLLSALGGALTVGAVYALGRAMFGERVAWFAGLFLIGLHFHNHFSRIGLNNIWDGLWFTLVIWLFWWGWEHTNRNALLLSGISLGLAQYFYVSSRALFAVIPLNLLLLTILQPASTPGDSAVSDHTAGKRSFVPGWPRLRSNLPGLALMGLACLVVVLPLANFFIQKPNEFFAPMARVSLFGEWLDYQVETTQQAPALILGNEILKSIQGIFSAPLRAWYSPGTPLLRPWAAALFWVALALLLRRFRSTASVILLTWVAGLAAIGGLSESAPAAQRYVAIAPALAVMVGVALDQIARLLEKLWPGHKKAAGVIVFIFALLLSLDELRFYYQDYTPRSNFGGDNALVAQRLANYLQTKDPTDDWKVAFFGAPRMGYYSYSTLPYLAPHVTGIEQTQPWGSPDNLPVAGDHLIFVFLPNNLTQLEAVKVNYPVGKLLEEKNPSGETLYWLYEVAFPE